MCGTDIVKHPIHLGRGATAIMEPVFTGSMEWRQGYTGRHADWHTADVTGTATAVFIIAGWVPNTARAETGPIAARPPAGIAAGEPDAFESLLRARQIVHTRIEREG